MKAPFLFENIVWAVDTMESPEFQQNAQFVIGSLVRKTEAKVWPIHFLTYPFARPLNLRLYEEAYLALAEKRLAELAGNSDIPQMRNGKVVVNIKGAVRGAVAMLIEYAEEKHADAIVVSTHSRGAVAKFFMGSFAETLLLESPIPVITVNPHSKVREKISKVLFPTTLAEKFRPAFENVVKMCASLGASLTLLYKEPFIPMLEPSYELFRYLEQEAANRQKHAERFREWAKPYHVPIEVHMDTVPGNVASEISSYASEHNFDLIVMVSESNDFEGPRVGSICRKVVRASDCPVWTIKTDDNVKGEID